MGVVAIVFKEMGDGKIKLAMRRQVDGDVVDVSVVQKKQARRTYLLRPEFVPGERQATRRAKTGGASTARSEGFEGVCDLKAHFEPS
jgi:hypothetical protein